MSSFLLFHELSRILIQYMAENITASADIKIKALFLPILIICIDQLLFYYVQRYRKPASGLMLCIYQGPVHRSY